jgi:para-aminobenzoate synthetase/4-amino-4-deoxychorismate lyase
VYDSIDAREYEEAMLKAKFLVKDLPRFSLIESILWQKHSGYFLLDYHLARLKKSCEYFSIPLDLNRIKRNLKLLAENNDMVRYKIRIVVSMEGAFKIEKEPLTAIRPPAKIKISAYKINPRDIFLYHKTSRRQLYDQELKKASREGLCEVIFFNTRGELAEGSFTNVFIAKNNHLYTPPVKCGLLPGVLRDYLLKNNKAKEQIIRKEDLMNAQKIYIGNSVRGLMEAELAC